MRVGTLVCRIQRGRSLLHDIGAAVNCLLLLHEKVDHTLPQSLFARHSRSGNSTIDFTDKQVLTLSCAVVAVNVARYQRRSIKASKSTYPVRVAGIYAVVYQYLKRIRQEKRCLSDTSIQNRIGDEELRDRLLPDFVGQQTFSW